MDFLKKTIALAAVAAVSAAASAAIPAGTARIAWDNNTMRDITEMYVDNKGYIEKNFIYPRIKRLKNGQLMMTFMNHRFGWEPYVALSDDDGATWHHVQRLQEQKEGTSTAGEDTFVYVNPDFVELADGRIMLAYQCRWKKGYNDLPHTNENCFIEIMFSSDNGLTWKPDFGQPAYTVVRHSWLNEQGAKRWTDQMPNTIELNNSRQLVTVTESKPDATAGDNFQISFAYSDETGDYPQLTGEMEGPAERSIDIWKGAAPTLIQFPSGETVVSYGESSRLTLRMGDANAKNWGEPEKVLTNARGSWGALEKDTPHSLLAVMPGNSHGMIALARFYLNHAITATARTANADGDNKEWANTDHAVFVGSKSAAQATLRCSADKDNIYFLVEVLDDNISGDDYINILLCPETATGNITSEARRIKVAPYGLRSTDQYAGGWHEIPMNVKVGTAFDGTIAKAEDTDHGYLVEVAVPRSELKIVNGEILVNLVMFDSQAGEEAIAPTTTNSLAKWIPVRCL